MRKCFISADSLFLTMSELPCAQVPGPLMSLRALPSILERRRGGGNQACRGGRRGRSADQSQYFPGPWQVILTGGAHVICWEGVTASVLASRSMSKGGS